MRKMNGRGARRQDFATVAAGFLAQRAGTSAGTTASATTGGFSDFWRKLCDFERLTLEQLDSSFFAGRQHGIGIRGILAAKRPAMEGWIIGATGVVQRSRRSHCWPF
jgi:hypothetical protein